MDFTFNYNSLSENDVQQLARRVAQIARIKDIFLLYGTLGMGKTVFAKAFISELSGVEEVPSPTFTLLQSYASPEFELYHYDLYRIEDEEELFELGIEDAFYDGVTLIEWPEKLGKLKPNNVFEITITQAKDHPDMRDISIKVSDENDNKQRLESIS